MTDLNLLVVDDDRDFSEGLAEYLELDGHRVDVASSGEEGIEACGKFDYDVVLMDIGLPGLNGVESLVKIKELSPEINCFLLTGYTAQQVVDQGLEAGALEILSKPVDLAGLLQRLSALFQTGK